MAPLFEFIQNNDLNARSYFSGPLGHLSYNYFGGAVGGPILKDKLFIFGDYLRTVDHEAVASTFTIPDSRYYTPTSVPLPGCTDPAGCVDLSAAMSGTKGQIYDPTSYTDGKVHDGTQGDPRPAFTNNQLPFSLIKGSVPLAMLPAECRGGKVRKADDQPSWQPRKQLHHAIFHSPRPPTASTSRSISTQTERNHLSGALQLPACCHLSGRPPLDLPGWPGRGWL